MSKGGKALFLDRDGTLIAGKDYLSEPDAVEILPGVREALARAKAFGCRLFLLTNQSGVGRGWFPLRKVHACNAQMLALLDLPAPLFTEICIAPEAPGIPSPYRKPSPRFLLEMIDRYHLDPENCYMIGDWISDLEAGCRAGVHSVFVKTGKKITEEIESFLEENKIPVFADLEAFVDTLGRK